MNKGTYSRKGLMLSRTVIGQITEKAGNQREGMQIKEKLCNILNISFYMKDKPHSLYNILM